MSEASWHCYVIYIKIREGQHVHNLSLCVLHLHPGKSGPSSRYEAQGKHMNTLQAAAKPWQETTAPPEDAGGWVASARLCNLCSIPSYKATSHHIPDMPLGYTYLFLQFPSLQSCQKLVSVGTLASLCLYMPSRGLVRAPATLGALAIKSFAELYVLCVGKGRKEKGTPKTTSYIYIYISTYSIYIYIKSVTRYEYK